MEMKAYLTLVDWEIQPEIIQNLIAVRYAKVKSLMINRVDRIVEIFSQTKCHQKSSAPSSSMKRPALIRHSCYHQSLKPRIRQMYRF